MSNQGNPPPTPGMPGENTPPSRKNDPLRGQQRPPPVLNSPPSVPIRGEFPSVSQPPIPSFPTRPPATSQPAPHSEHGHVVDIVNNTRYFVQDWSGRLAAFTGHGVQPPAPVLERYHQQLPAPVSRRLPPSRKPAWRRSHAVRVVHLMRNRRKRWQSKQLKPGHIWSAIGIAFALLIIIVSSAGSAYGYTFYQSELPQVQRLANLQISQTTRIYDRNMLPLYDAYDNSTTNSGRRTVVTYDDIPQVMQDAMIAIEDHTFWDNIGIDPLAIVRSASQANGSGASSITQQVVKNLSHKDQRTLDRKITEAAIAIGLTQQYPKEKILEMYFNVAPFGPQDRGVESAVEEYFGLEPACLNNTHCTPGIRNLDYDQKTNTHSPLLALARASLLAGMPNQPSTNDPTQGGAHLQSALARQKDVLDLMISFNMSYGAGLITPAIARQAEDLTAKMTFTPYKKPNQDPHFVQWVINQVETALGNGNADAGVDPFLTGGFNIRTTIDSNLEKYVEDAVTRHLTQPELQLFTRSPTGGRDYGPLNLAVAKGGHGVNDAAVVVMNSKTGEILAMDGSADYNNTSLQVSGQVNVATATPGRQPGSSFKPIVYATAFEMGWYPGMVLPDTKTYFPNGHAAGTPIPTTLAQEQDPNAPIYTPGDYGGGYHGNISPMTVRLATANSFNVPAVKALSFAGIDNVANTAERMGITALATKQANNCPGQTASQCFGASLVLGTTEVPLLQMVGAYQVFADQGLRVAPQGILDIWDNYGHNLYHYDSNAPQGTPVLSPQVSYMMTSILQDEYSRYTEFHPDHDLSFYDKAPNQCDLPDYQACPYQVAAKTGTSSNFIDNWTIGYTPGVVVGVWAGNANSDPMNNVVGITGAAPIWHSVMEYASHGWCNVQTDNIPCPPIDLTKLNINPTNTFVPAANLHKQCVSGSNGLLGGGGSCDWMPDGQDPLQSGVAASTNANPTQ